MSGPHYQDGLQAFPPTQNEGVTMDGERPAHYSFGGSIRKGGGIGHFVNKAKLKVAIHLTRTI